MALMPPMHVITYTDDDGTVHKGEFEYTDDDGTVYKGEFEFYESALSISSMAPNGAYVGQRVWPLAEV